MKRMTHRHLARLAPPSIVGGVVVGVWYFVSMVILDDNRRFLLRAPHEVLRKGFLTWSNLSEILGGLGSSAEVAFVGLLIAVVLGLMLGMLMSLSKSIERAIFPYAVVVQAMPILAIVPLIGFWFGYGFSSRVFVCVLISVFPIVVNTLFGLLSAEPGLHDLFTLQGASRWVRLRKLMLPAALPAIFAGLRISAGLSVIGAIVGDFFFAQGQAGIGQLLKKYASRLQGEELLAAVILSSALGVVVFLAFGWLARLATGRWSQESRGR
jgi:NitT/TauT family transport system permease protein